MECNLYSQHVDDGLCTTRGLWQYLNTERYFDSLTVRDIDDILTLDGTTILMSQNFLNLVQ
jgi:hypothetical protein